jgi:magnesium-transporting ATPase (P-type)
VGLMQKPPRNPKEGIFNRLMISQIIVSGSSIGLIAFSIWDVLLNLGYDETHARTLVFMFMVLVENIHIFNCRSELNSAFKIPITRNRFLIYSVLIAQSIHILAIHIPFMQKVLESDSVSLNEWLWLLGLAALLLPIMETFKWIFCTFIEVKNDKIKRANV